MVLLGLTFHKCFNCFCRAAMLFKVLLVCFSQPFRSHPKNESDAPAGYLGAVRRGHNQARPLKSVREEEFRSARKPVTKPIHNLPDKVDFVTAGVLIDRGDVTMVPVLLACGANLTWAPRAPHEANTLVGSVLASRERNAHLRSVGRPRCIDLLVVKILAETGDSEQI